MSVELKVLGVDLASRSWRDNGAAIVSFRPETENSPADWVSVDSPIAAWPEGDLSPAAMAEAIVRLVKTHGISAVSLDGPQGWRESNAANRSGVGRWCEYQARCQGKTGEYGRTYPQTQIGWIRFCIDVFREILEKGDAQLVNDPDAPALHRLDGSAFWLLECFPTSTWRTSGLQPLPGKRRTSLPQIVAFGQTLWQRFRLPAAQLGKLSHDDLQAVVACLPAAALMGGPCLPRPHGKASWQVDEPMAHRVEGIIWDAVPPADWEDDILTVPEELKRRVSRVAELDVNSPLIADERAEVGDEALDRGVRLFERLVELANRGEPRGIGYKQLVEFAYAQPFDAVMGRGWGRADVPFVLELARQITAAAGGRQTVTRATTTIHAGMDTFVWTASAPYSRNLAAFGGETPYNFQEWITIFPDGDRRLISQEELDAIL